MDNPRSNMKVLIYPRGNNPYQELLYQELRRDPSSSFTYIEPTRLNIALFPLILISKRLQGYTVLHLHWLSFQTNLLKIYGKQLSFVLTMWSLVWVKILSFKLVWTVHNVIPHEPLTSNDVFVARYLSKNANAKIAHSTNTIKQMRGYGLSVSNTTIIPHGTYNGVYRSRISKLQARKRLHIAKDDFTILFFGQVRPYKGIIDLILALEDLHLPNVRLVIAGKCDDERVAEQISLLQRRVKIDFYNNFIPENDVATFFRACDLVCLPFKRITTSGSALLPMSFSKPTVLPRLGALSDIPEDAALFYDPIQKNGLKTVLLAAVNNRLSLSKTGKAGYDYSLTLTWDAIAQQTFSVYQEVLNKPNNGNS